MFCSCLSFSSARNLLRHIHAGRRKPRREARDESRPIRIPRRTGWFAFRRMFKYAEYARGHRHFRQLHFLRDRTRSINGGPSLYAIAGAIRLDSNGNVVGGKQDYNDGFGLTSPQPAGDKITGGPLTQTAGTQQGTLTLITNNSALGVSGTEIFALQVVNDNHGLITQYDGTATSSGSFDLQTLPATPSGNFAFTLSGYFFADAGTLTSNPFATGGIFSVSGTNLQNGIVDVNNNGATTLGTAFTATISAPDSFGRGTVTNISDVSIGTTVNYYVVNSKVLSLIVVDAADSAVGSAFSQGTGTFSDSSLGPFAFSVISNSWSNTLYSVAGSMSLGLGVGARPATTKRRPESSAGGASFIGVADVNEAGAFLSGESIAGTYATQASGYGSFQFTTDSSEDVSIFGVYLTDPAIDLIDPNNSVTPSGAAGATGGALIAEMDALVGTGFLLPQTDTTASFAGSYALGGQIFNNSAKGWEADFLRLGTITSLAFGSATGFLKDAFGTISSTLKSAVSFSGTAVADVPNPGRYTMSGGTPLGIAYSAMTVPFTATIYQASGKELVWIEVDNSSLFGGTLEQLTTATGAADKPAEHLPRIIHR
jgi:hypothetical protein